MLTPAPVPAPGRASAPRLVRAIGLLALAGAAILPVRDPALEPQAGLATTHPEARAPSGPPAETPGAPSGRGVASAPRIVQRPRLRDPACLSDALRFAGATADDLGERAKVRVQVTAGGAVAAVDLLGGPLEPRVAEALFGALRACSFTPALNARGRAVATAHVLEIEFRPRLRAPARRR